MDIKKAEFLMSNTRFEFLPNDNIPEYAFIGRSNVGKSSLINMLVQRRGLAKTSSVPGKTVAINHFIVNDAWYLVDLPGYGYAQHSKKTREQWRVMINNYITRRRNLASPRPTRCRRPSWTATWRHSRRNYWKNGRNCRPSSSPRQRRRPAATMSSTTSRRKTPRLQT